MDGVAALEHPAIHRAIAHRDHKFRVRRGSPGPAQRVLHVAGNRAGDQQHIGMARAGDEVQAEPFQVVDDAVQHVDFQLAAIAAARIHHADRQTAPQTLMRTGRQPLGQCLRGRFADRLGGDGEWAAFEVAGDAAPDQ